MYNTYLTKYNQVHDDYSPLIVNLNSDIIGSEIHLEMEVEVLSEVSSLNNKAVFILTSYQDDDYFCSVISYDYEPFSYSSIGDTVSYSIAVDIQPDWNLDLIKFVGMVQSYSDDRILQANEMSVPLNNLMVLDSQISNVNDLNGGDGDGIANPGEEAVLSIAILNNSMELSTSSTNIYVSSMDSNIELPESNFMFQGQIDSGQLYNFEVPISISEDIPLGVYSFLISIESSYTDNYGNNLVYTNSYDREIPVNLYQGGFPYIVSSQVLSAPAIIDLDQDGVKEIIFGDYIGNLHAIDIYGHEKNGFPIDLGDQIWSSPSVYDIDLDGDLETIICSKNKRILAINSDGTEQFSYNTNKYLIGTPALGNIDDDDDLEIIVASYHSPSSTNKIYAVNPDGTDVEGFPFTIGEKVKIGVALADFNENGKVDIVVGTDDENLYLIYDDAQVADGFPFHGDSDFKSEPIVVEYDGSRMILAGTKDGTLYAINGYGETIFSINTSDDIMSSPSVFSYQNEILISFGNDDGEIYVISLDGTIKENWPVTLSSAIVSSPTFSDFNLDGVPEIVVSLDQGNLHILNLDGTDFDNSPFSYAFPYTSSVTIEDIDLDGDLEILCGSGDGVNVFDIKQNGSSASYWNTFRGNYKRNGFYRYTMSGDVNQDSNTDILDIIIIVNYVLEVIDSISYEHADYNNDGVVNILDITMLVNGILQE